MWPEIRRQLEEDDERAEPLEEEDDEAFEPDDDPLELTTISTSWKTDGPASGLQANGGSRNGETAATICETLGIGRTTLYRYLAESAEDLSISRQPSA